jgi:hypothetical protein
MFVHAIDDNRTHATDPNTLDATLLTATHSVVPDVGKYTWNPFDAVVNTLPSTDKAKFR